MDNNPSSLWALTAMQVAGSTPGQYGTLLVLALLGYALWRFYSPYGRMPVHHQLDYRASLIGYPRYVDYLASGHWHRMKTMIHKKYHNKCNVCAKQKDHVVHHRTYERIGKEYTDDLVLLCSKCHRETHKLANSGTPLLRADLVYKRNFTQRNFSRSHK